MKIGKICNMEKWKLVKFSLAKIVNYTNLQY